MASKRPTIQPPLTRAKRSTLLPPDDPTAQRLYLEYLRAMYVLFKSSFVYDTNNSALVATCERVAAAANQIRDNLADIATLELHGDGTYVNRTLLKLDPSTYDQADYLYAVFHTLGVSAIAALGETSAADWLEMIAVFKRAVGTGGNHESFVKATFANVMLTPTEDAAGFDLLELSDRMRAARAYASTVVAIAEVITAAREGRALRPLRVKRSLQEMILLAETTASTLLALAHLKRNKLAPEHHLANTAVFTICAVHKLGLTRSTCRVLALCAALHDIGRAITALEGPSGPGRERWLAMRSVHKLVGAPLASKQMNDRAVVANEVRRWFAREIEPPGDAGYPYQLGAAGRIVAIAHAYNTLTTPQAGRGAVLPDEALRVIMREAGRRYDAVAVRMFVNALGVYPVGASVALSDGRAAVVIETPQGASRPSEPRVKVTRDAQGDVCDGELIDLARADLRIVRCIDGEYYEINAPAHLLG
jgi:hypothetical protein